MKLLHLFLPLVLTLPCVHAANLLDYMFTGTASGTLGGTPFSGAQIVFHSVGDVADVTTQNINAGHIYRNSNVTTWVAIPGFSLAFIANTYVFDGDAGAYFSAVNGLLGFGQGGDLFSFFFPFADGYNLQHTASVALPPSYGGWATLNRSTSAGALSITSFDNVVFDAVASTGAPTAASPEPSSFALVLAGAAAFCLQRRKRA